MSAGICLRQATMQDYLEVLAINDDIYDGLDYMPVMFPYFLQSSKYNVIVGELKGKIVALINIRFQPDEKLILGFSARSSPSLSSSAGIRTAGKSPWKTFILKNYPKLEFVLGVTNTFPKLYDGSRTIYYQWLVKRYKASVVELHSRLIAYKPTYSKSLIDITYSDVEHIMSGNRKIETFIKRYCNEFVVCQWHSRPMKIDDQADMKELFATSSKTFITLASASGHNFEQSTSLDIRNLLRQPDNNITSLSYSVPFPVKLGLRCNITFFGQSPECLADHVRAHISHVTEIYSGNVAVYLHFPELEAIKPAEVENQLRLLLGDSASGDGPEFRALWSRNVIIPTSKI